MVGFMLTVLHAGCSPKKEGGLLLWSRRQSWLSVRPSEWTQDLKSLFTISGPLSSLPKLPIKKTSIYWSLEYRGTWKRALLSSGLWIIFILHLIKFLWNVLIFSRQLAIPLLGIWEPWEGKDLVLPSPLSSQLFLGWQCQNVNAVSKSWLLAPEVTAVGALSVF